MFRRDPTLDSDVPSWAQPGLIVTLALGFVPALIFSWASRLVSCIAQKSQRLFLNSRKRRSPSGIWSGVIMEQSEVSFSAALP